MYLTIHVTVDKIKPIGLKTSEMEITTMFQIIIF